MGSLEGREDFREGRDGQDLRRREVGENFNFKKGDGKRFFWKEEGFSLQLVGMEIGKIYGCIVQISYVKRDVILGVFIERKSLYI